MLVFLHFDISKAAGVPDLHWTSSFPRIVNEDSRIVVLDTLRPLSGMLAGKVLKSSTPESKKSALIIKTDKMLLEVPSTE